MENTSLSYPAIKTWPDYRTAVSAHTAMHHEYETRMAQIPSEVVEQGFCHKKGVCCSNTAFFVKKNAGGRHAQNNMAFVKKITFLTPGKA